MNKWYIIINYKDSDADPKNGLLVTQKKDIKKEDLVVSGPFSSAYSACEEKDKIKREKNVHHG